MSQNTILKGMIDIKMKIVCLTGLRIGTGSEALEIGGVENIVTKNPLTRLPYVPGSSLKGAMRAHYELYSGKPINYEVVKGDRDRPAIKIHSCSDLDCEICRVFGRPADSKHIKLDQAGSQDAVFLTRLKVDDSFPTEDTRKWWDAYCPGGVEIKYENVLDRLTSHANPRQVERVPAGSEFEVNMSYKIFDEKDVDNIKVVFQALKLVEDDYLGGYGSRGYGRLRFVDISVVLKNREYYDKCGENHRKEIVKYNSLDEMLKKIQDIIQQLKIGLKISKV